MKKLLALAIVAFTVAASVGCGGGSSATTSGSKAAPASGAKS